MKATLLLLAAMIYTNFCNAQNTTEIEYNYIKKGIKASEDQGLDMKVGYELLPIFNKNIENITVDLKILKRIKDGSIAGTLMRISGFPKIQTLDLCLPAMQSGDGYSYGNKQFTDDFNMLNGLQREALTYCLLAVYDLYSKRLNDKKMELRIIPQ